MGRLGNFALSMALVLLLGGCDDHDGGDAGRDAGGADAGAMDAGTEDAGTEDAGAMDAGLDGGAMDAGLDADVDGGVDAAMDAGTDAGAPGVTCAEPGLTAEVIMDSASVGTPDTYFRDVTPGDPFCAEITGGGSGSWGVTVSDGTSTGVYCSDVPRCAIRVPAGVTTLLVTAITSDIGFYTLTIHRVLP